MIKNVFIISLVLLFLALVFFGVYNFAFDNISKLKKTETSKEEERTSVLPEEGSKKIVAISDEPVLGATFDMDEKKIRFYDKRNGNVMEVTPDGSIKKVLFENDLSNLKSVLWSPNKNFVISGFGSGSDKKFYLYSYVTRRSVELKSGIDEIIWDNQGEKIIYKYFDESSEERSLNVSDPNGKNWETLTTLDGKFKKSEFAHVPQTLFVSFWNYPNAFEESSLSRVNLLDENEKKEILFGKFGADYLWSPNGRKVLISSVDKGGRNLKLEVLDIGSDKINNLVAPTVVEKCAWSNNNEDIFCSMPSEISGESVMPNDYQEAKILTRDTFWKINVESGKKDRVIELDEIEEKYDATELFLSPNEDMLFFTNRHDNKLYRLIL